jgi:hypothetical protein
MRCMPEDASYSNIRILVHSEPDVDTTLQISYISQTESNSELELRQKLENEGGEGTSYDFPPPIILTQPIDSTVYELSLFSFSVYAISDTLNLQYQWYFGSEIISDATSNIYSNYASITDIGNYWCRVTNDTGSIDSSSAYLLVLEYTYNEVLYYATRSYHDNYAFAQINMTTGNIEWAANPPTRDSFTRIYVLAVDEEGSVYGWDDYYEVIYKFDVYGNYLWKTSQTVDTALVCGPGVIYYGKHFISGGVDQYTIYKVDKNNNILWERTESIRGNGSTASVDAYGNLYFAYEGDGSNFTKFDRDGNLLWRKFLDFTMGWYNKRTFAVDSNGNIYTSQYDGNNQAAKWDTDGNFIWASENYQLEWPHAIYFNDICVGIDNNVYIAASDPGHEEETCLGGIQIDGTTGERLVIYCNRESGLDGIKMFYYNTGIAVDQDSNVYLSFFDDYDEEHPGPRLNKYTNDGTLIYSKALAEDSTYPFTQYSDLPIVQIGRIPIVL